jgi:hypothetical protein
MISKTLGHNSRERPLGRLGNNNFRKFGTRRTVRAAS